MRKVVRLSLVILILAIGAVLSGIVSFNAGFIRGPIETAVYDATGLPLSIHDRIVLRLGPKPAITSGGIVFGNPAGSPLLAVDSLSAKIGLLDFLRGKIHVHDLNMSGLLVDYCSPLPIFSGASNEDTAPPSVAVDAINLEQIMIRCGPPTQVDPLHIDVVQATGSAPADAPIQLNTRGSVSEIDFTLIASGGELDQLLTKADRFPVQVSLASASAAVEISGHLESLLTKPAIDAHLNVRVPNVQSFSETFGLSLPAIGALQAQGQVRSDFELIELLEVRGELGESLFTFDATVDPGGERAHVVLTAALEQLDLTPFVNDGAATAQPPQVAEGVDIDLGTTIDMLGKLDADIRFTAARIFGAPLDLDAVEINTTITNGNVEIHSLALNVLGGNAAVSGIFHSQSECPDLKLMARGSDFDLATLNALLPLNERLGGHVDTVNLDVSSCGRTLFTHRDSLQAKVELLDGRVSLDDDPFPLKAIRFGLDLESGGNSRAQLFGELTGERIEATLTTVSWQALLSPGTWPVELEAHGAGGRFNLKGQAGVAAGQPVLDAAVEFEALHIGTMHPWTAGSPDAELPLRTTVRLRLDESRLVADTIALSFGRSDLSGDLAWNHASDPDVLALTLHSSYLDLDEINTVFPAAIEQFERADSLAADNKSEPIPSAVTLPPVDLDLMIDAVHSSRLDLQDFNISGRLRAGLIDDARVSLRVEDEVLLRGVLDLDLRNSATKASLDVGAENVDIGLLMARLEVADDIQLRADELELLVNSEGGTLGQLVANTLLEARIQGFYWRIPERSPDPGEETDRAFDLSLAQLSLTTAPNRSSTWSANGQLDGVLLNLWMETPSLIDTFGDTAELPFTLVAAADDDVVMLEARLDRSAEERVAAHIRLSGAILESKNRSLAQLTAPLTGYQVQSDLFLTENKLELPDLQMQLGTSTANGRFTVTGDGKRRRFELDLNASHLQTDDFLYWSRDTPDESIDVDNAPIIDDENSRSRTTESRGVLFKAKDLIAALRENNDFDVNITVDELRAGNNPLGGGEIHLFVDEDDFSLKPLTFSRPGGSVNAEYTASIRDGRLDAGLKIQADAFIYGGLLRLLDPKSEARGVLYLDADISANTELSPGAVPLSRLFENAGGSISFAAWPENIEAGVLDLWTANLVLALLPRPVDGKASRLNCIATRFDIENGVMVSRNPLLDSTDTIIRGRGTIDLGKEELDLLVWPQAKREKFLSASTPVKVTGTFNDFQIGIEPAGFIGTMIKWYTGLIYVPFKWLTGQRFPPDGTATCFDAMDWELTPELHDYFLRRDFSAPP